MATTTKNNPPTPKRSGTLEGPFQEANGREFWRGKVRLVDGSRARVEIPESHRYDKGKTRVHLKKAQKDEDATHAIYNAKVAMLARKPQGGAGTAPSAGTGELAEQWYARYLDVHEKLGRKTVGHLGSWKMWCAPYLAGKPMTAITTADIFALRDNLTQARTAGKIGAKRAINIWGDQVKTPFSRAFTDDDPDYKAVRVGPAKDNPSLNIKPPATSEHREEDDRERQALEPAMFLALVNDAVLSLHDRRLCAVEAYTGLSPSEVYGIKWRDVRLDAERPHILVQRGRDMKSGAEIGTKNRQRNRKVPIHPELRELVGVMRDEVNDKDAYVFDPGGRVRDVESLVARLRSALERCGAGEELVRGTETLRAFDVRSLRTTFATWCTKACYDSSWVRVWLGHKPQTVAEKHYVKDTPHFEDVLLKAPRPGVVPPFPPLPESLFGDDEEVSERSPAVTLGAIGAKTLCEGRDLNPYRSYPTGT